MAKAWAVILFTQLESRGFRIRTLAPDLIV